MNRIDLLASSFKSFHLPGTARECPTPPAMMSGILSPSIKQVHHRFLQAISKDRAKFRHNPNEETEVAPP
jgi:hypothetical protein